MAAKPILERDKNLEVEALPNGMTVAVFKNAEPPNRVSMRLLVKRGSAYETEGERGIAHFVEHMAFNGTKHFPSGDMVEYFQRLGMAFGADTNAHTGFSETVYKIDMPEVSKKLVDDGLTLLRDYCDSVMFEPKSIESERGVIIAEKDSRDTQDYRKAVKEIAHTFKGSIFAERMPIGIEGVINSVKQPDFKKFYAANYRPENTVLVVVGDIDPREIFAAAKRIFADFKANPAVPAREADFGKLETSNVKFTFGKTPLDIDAIYDSTPNTPRSYASVAVAKQPESREDTLERRVEDFRRRALAATLTARFLRVADRPESKFSQGGAGTFQFDKYCDVFIVNTEAPVGGGFDALEEGFRQLFGAEKIGGQELETAKKKIFENLESEIKAAPTRKSRSLANDIVSAFSDGETTTSPEKDLEIAKYALGGFGADDASALLKNIFDNAKIKVFVSDAKPEPDAASLDASVKRAFENAAKSTYPAETFAAASLVFSKFGAAGKVAERREIKELGITQVKFENGARLNVKRTDFAKDEAAMKISFGRGLLDIPADKPEYFAAIYALVAGGTKFQTVGEINAAKFPMKMSLGISVDGNAFAFGAKSSAKHFPDALRLAATMFADAGFREDGREALLKYGEAYYLDYRTDPMSKLRFLPVRIVKSGLADVPGDFENFKKIGMDEIGKWFAPILEKSYAEISVVGDVEVEAVISLVAETFGAMPPREADNPEPYAKLELLPPADKIEMRYETTDEPRSIAVRMWRSAGRTDIEKMRADNVLGAVLDDVLRKDVREAQGKVYSPFAYNNASTWIDGAGLMTAATFVVPKFNAELLETLEKCGKKVAESITEDEFERAKIPLIKGVEANKRKNSYWLEAVLDRSQCRPVNIELAKSIDTGYAGVSLETVRRRAKEIFGESAYSASVMPERVKKELKK